jgi:hypothetical protein
MKEWQEKALRWHEHGWDYKQIAQELVETTSEFDDPVEAYQIVRRFIYKYNMRHGDNQSNQNPTKHVPTNPPLNTSKTEQSFPNGLYRLSKHDQRMCDISLKRMDLTATNGM